MSKQPKVTKAFEKVLNKEFLPRIEKVYQIRPMKTTDVVFYISLLQIAIDYEEKVFNLEFQKTDYAVNALCQMTRKTFLQSRERLKELGLIDFEVITSHVAVYKLI